MMFQVKLNWPSSVVITAVTLWTGSAAAHQLWIEADSAANTDREQIVHVCWGSFGHKESGESLEKQQGKFSVWLAKPEGQRRPLDLAIGSNSFTTKIAPCAPGYCMIGAETQIGILSREFHGIPAKTRIIMYGKTFTHVKGSDEGLAAPLGMDVEMVPVSHPDKLYPGDIVTGKVLIQGKPAGGQDVLVTLNALGTEPLPEDERIHGLQWSVESTPDPRTGEVSFPLIVGGQHQFYIKYMDATPGSYEGDREVATEYSHLRKGDTYERTLYISTFTLNVKTR